MELSLFLENLEKEFKKLEKDCKIFKEEVILETIKKLEEGASLSFQNLKKFEKKKGIMEKFSANKGYSIEYISDEVTYHRITFKFFRDGKITIIMTGGGKKEFENENLESIIKMAPEIKKHLWPSVYS